MEIQSKLLPETSSLASCTTPDLSLSISELAQRILETNADVMSRQATINIGVIGHVAHGKTTLVKAMTGVKTVKFKQECVRNITMKLGYANAKIFKCTGKCKNADAYASYGSEMMDDPLCEKCNSKMQLERHVSFVDCPGHNVLMTTMLNGTAVMDAAILVVSCDSKCPQPQTVEHLMAVEMMRLKHIIIVQNKIDLAKEETIRKHYQEIKSFVQGTRATHSPIIPAVAQSKANIDAILEAICKIPIPERDLVSPPKVMILRSFDVNKPGTSYRALTGGVAGGSIISGTLTIGQEVELRPGISMKDEETGKQIYVPIKSHVTSLYAEKNQLSYAIPGGLIGIGLSIDPSLTHGDRLIGKLLGVSDSMPSVMNEIEVKYHHMPLLAKTDQVKTGEHLQITLGSMTTEAVITNQDSLLMRLSLLQPVCCLLGDKCVVSRKIQQSWRLIGWGTVVNGIIVSA